MLVRETESVLWHGWIAKAIERHEPWHNGIKYSNITAAISRSYADDFVTDTHTHTHKYLQSVSGHVPLHYYDPSIIAQPVTALHLRIRTQRQVAAFLDPQYAGTIQSQQTKSHEYQYNASEPWFGSGQPKHLHMIFKTILLPKFLHFISLLVCLTSRSINNAFLLQ